MLKVPQWITARRGDDDMDDDCTVPPIATLPPPEFSTHDEESMLVQRAAALHAQLKRSIETAQVELAESVLANEGEKKKSAFLEKENAELRLVIAERDNIIATLQSSVIEHKGLLDLLKDINDKATAAFNRLSIAGQPKKERKPRPKKKADRESATETAETAETIG